MNIIYIGKHKKMFNVDYHSHTYGEIIYCTSGTGTFTDSLGHATHYKKGDAVIVPPGLVHSNTSDEGFSNFYLAVTQPDKIPTEISCVNDNERLDMYHCIDQIYFYFNCKTQNREAILSSLTELILQYLLTFSGTYTLSKYSELISQHIINNFSESGYRPVDFLKTLPFNNEYLSKKFTKETGKTPSQYLSSLRISHAKEMLQKQKLYDLTIKEIAVACGFSDALYFSRVFKSTTGQSPSEYVTRFLHT